MGQLALGLLLLLNVLWHGRKTRLDTLRKRKKMPKPKSRTSKKKVNDIKGWQRAVPTPMHDVWF